MPRAFFLFLTVAPLFGQATAITDDGSQTYFVSSLVLRGSTGGYATPKLFKYDGTSFSLVVQIADVIQANGVASFWALLEPRLSGDGSVVGYVATQGCGNSCNLAQGQGYQTTLQFPGPAGPLTLPYYCQISKNAQYALCVTSQPSLQQIAIVNLSTMQTSAPQFTACHGSNLITSDGHALAWNQQQMSLFNSTGVQQIPGDPYACPVISDDGSTIVYASHQGLIAYSVATGATTALTPPCDSCNQPGPSSITNDGKLVLAGTVLFHTDGSGSMPLTGSILAGNSVVSLSGLATTLAPTPMVVNIDGGTAPGSQLTLQGQNFSSTTAAATSFPGPTSLAGVEVKINGTDVPLISASPTAVSFQIPWELPFIDAPLELVTSTESQFVQGPLPIGLSPFSPFLESAAITEDFSALITQSNPANPGDIVNFYLTGLGPVTFPQPDSVPAPASPLPLLVNAITVSYGLTPLRIYYAGLAPGLVGIYQLTVQTPTQVPQRPGLTGPVFVNLGLQLSPPQSAVPFSLTVVMNPNQ